MTNVSLGPATLSPVLSNVPLHNKPAIASSCCGGAATNEVDACCALDESLKASGGCGCNTESATAAASGADINPLIATERAGTNNAACC